MVDITICMVSYNHKKYIAQAIDSVLAQETTYSYEIIVGDDASPDGTAAYVREKYAKELNQRVFVLEQPQNVGLTRNMYEVLTHARGRYIYTCAGDDWIIDTQMLQKHVDFLEQNPKYSSVSNWRITVDEDGNKLYDGKMDHTEYVLEDMLLKHCYTDGGMGTIRNYFKDETADLSFLYKCSRNNEELQLSLYVYGKGPHKILPEAMIAYRYVKKAGGTNYNSTHNAVQKFEESYHAVQNLRKYYPVHNYDGMEIRYIYMYMYQVVRSLSIKQVARYVHLIGPIKLFRMIWLAPMMKAKGGELPQYIVNKIY